MRVEKSASFYTTAVSFTKQEQVPTEPLIIPVTKAYLPSKEKYQAYVEQVFESALLTNNGALVRTLEQRLKNYLGVKNIILVANGSLALQVAYKALALTGEVITTPFSFVATTSTLQWHDLTPVFADIDPHTFNINPEFIEQSITGKTSAILPVHVFGNPCDIEAIQAIADKHHLKVIYDAAHAFNCQYKGQSVLNYGDISTLSFHATKLFHTIEGGAIITNDDQLAKKIRLLINFGISGPHRIESLGTNAKMNELEAAMGLCVLDEIENIQHGRAQVWEYYCQNLSAHLTFQKWSRHSSNNHAYAPVLFSATDNMLKAETLLKEKNIYPRRYFSPSLDTLTYLNSNQVCLYSRDVASRILCLPMYPTIEKHTLALIVKLLQEIT